MKNNRREFLKKTGIMAATVSVGGLTSCTGSGEKKSSPSVDAGQKSEIAEWPVPEAENTPKLCVYTSSDSDEAEMRRLKQIGVDYVIVAGPRVPWTKEDLLKITGHFASGGLKVINMFVGGGNHNTIYGLEGRDKEIADVKESIVSAGAAGVPVLEYNFYAHRFMDGYYAKEGRGGSGVTAFDYAPVKELPPDKEPITAEKLWANLAYFLKEVIPVAEKAGVRLALHPNDPPIPVSHGSDQIIASFKDWKRLFDIVDSPSNGMTYDCGVCREMGENPLEVYKYMRSRDRVNHIHYRNVTVDEPYYKYEEVFFDTGIVNMFEVMKEIVRSGYKLGVFPEHQRALDYDREHGTGIRGGYPGGGGYAGLVYNVAYARAMMQAALSLNPKI